MKVVKKIAIEWSDGSKEVIFTAPIEAKPEKIIVKDVAMLSKITAAKTIAYVAKIDSEKESQKGGTYQRHWFRNPTTNEFYILDVNKFSSSIFKHLKVGDTLGHLTVFTLNGKKYINGKSKAELIGQWENIKHLWGQKIGFTI